MPPPIKPQLSPQIEAIKPWNDPSLMPENLRPTPTPVPKPTPPGAPVAAETAPYTYETPDPVALSSQLEAFRNLVKSVLPEWLWNTPSAVPKPKPTPQ
jgi:hypothetical protein